MNKKKIERARYLFNKIGWWARQEVEEDERAFELACKDRIVALAREGYYLLGEVLDPFPNNKELGKESNGIICLAVVCLIVAAIIWWRW